MSTASKRIQKELQLIQKGSEFDVVLVDGNLYHWRTTISGPDNTPYENGIFGVDITIPIDYPFTPVCFIFILNHCFKGFALIYVICPAKSAFHYKNLSLQCEF